jgi:hypothetical protein
MRPALDIGKLSGSCQRRLVRLKVLVDGRRPPIDGQTDRLLAFAAIETLSLWAGFVRAYYISCSLGARLLNGSRVLIAQPGILTGSDAVRFAAQRIKRKSLGVAWRPLDEPSWRQPTTLLRISSAIGFSHNGQVTAAFSTATKVFDDLPEFRNFYAHRSEVTAGQVTALATAWGITARLHPSEVIASYLPGRPQNVIADWIDDVATVIDLLCQ